MDVQELMSHFRAQVRDEAPPFLWSYQEVLEFVVDAQDMFVRRTGGIADVSVAAADIGSPQTRLQDLSLTASSPYSAVSPYILRITKGRLLTAARDVSFANQSDLPQMWYSDYGSRYTETFDDTDTGEVRYGVLDVRDGYVRWLKVPDDTDTCRLFFRRLPYPRIADDDDSLEIGIQHHIHLLKWMKHRAFSKQDAEVYDKDAAEKNEKDFFAYCDDARKEIERRRFKPRTVHYGGL